MKMTWTKGLEKELAKDVRSNFVEALVLRRRLVQILSDMAEDSQRVSRAKLSYDNANWALLQADSRGYERALHDIINLISENT